MVQLLRLKQNASVHDLSPVRGHILCESWENETQALQPAFPGPPVKLLFSIRVPVYLLYHLEQ